MTKEHTPEEIKYRLSDLGIQIGNIAVEYITELEKENAELKKQLRDKKCNDKGCPVFIKLVQANKKNADLRTRLNAINLLTPELEKHLKAKEQQLTKAKKIIKTLVADLSMYSGNYQKVLLEAKQFLEEDSTYERIQKAKYNYID